MTKNWACFATAVTDYIMIINNDGNIIVAVGERRIKDMLVKFWLIFLWKLEKKS